MRKTLQEISDKGGVSLSTVRTYVDKGVIRGYKDGRGHRIVPDGERAIRTIRGINSGKLKLRELVKNDT